ncbi:MAG: type II secretion system F family protein, partial [Thermodesulfobacteriota bacterium]
MPIYEYKGVDTRGKVVKGVMSADDPQSAHRRLKGEGVYITEPISEEEGEISSKKWWDIPLYARPGSKDLYLMTYQLKTLLGAGLPIVEALEVLVIQEENHYMKKALARVKERVSEGSSLADAMGESPEVFNDFYTKIVATGEASGSLENVLEQLFSYLERQEQIRSRIVQASAYPILMTIIGAVILFFLMTSIVPRVLEVFQDTQRALPLPTRILIGLSNLFANWWFLIIIIIAGIIYVLRRFLKTERGRSLWEDTLIKIPVLGKLSLNIILYRFSKTMETLLRSGLTIMQALSITRKAIHHVRIEAALKEAEGVVSEGRSLAEALKRDGIFPVGVTHMIGVGERSGEMDEAFLKVSQVYDRSIETSLGGLLSLIEPILIVVMGGVVGFIVLSILLPIFEMSQM